MIIDEDNIRVQYESTKESPILRDDVLPYPYKYTEKDQIYVLEGTTELTREQDFTVSYDGSVTILKDIPAGTVLTIYRSTPLDQGSEFPQEAPFSSKKIEDALDKLTMQNQEQREALSRALKLPMTASTELSDLEMPTPEPNRSVKWNADGTALINTNFDPDTALEQTERFKKEAEQAAKDAVAAKESITTTEETLVNTAKQATDEITRLSEETQETIETASKHKLNSKEIGSLLFSSVPNTSSDLHLADGTAITNEDPCWAEFHNIWAKQKRDAYDQRTTVYKYASTNYSRMWYSTIKSVPDKHYALQDVLNLPQGTIFLLDRAGNKHFRNSLSVQSYYKYELINAVGDTAPHQYLLLPIEMGDNQIVEPSKDHIDNFYVYADDYRIGVNYTDITNLDILPPDVTSEYRRILLTREVAGNTYYYYYKATPVKIQAFMVGSVADLNLGGAVGVQTQDTVIRPILITTPVSSFILTENKEFLTTAQFDAQREQHDEFYTNISSKDSDTTYTVDFLTPDFTTASRTTGIIAPLSNKEGWVDGFCSWWYSIPFDTHPGTELAANGDVVNTKVKTLDVEIQFTTGMRGAYQRVLWGPTSDFSGGIHLGIMEETRADRDGVPQRNRLEWLIPNTTLNGWALGIVIPYELEEYKGYKTKFVLTEDGFYHVYFAELDKEYEEIKTDVCPFIPLAASPELRLGADFADNLNHFRGKIDMKNTHFILNGVERIASGLKPYAKNVDNTYFEPYTSSDVPKLATKPFANVYESNPTGYALVNLIEDVDGWCAPTAANCGHWYGTGDNSAWIRHEADNYIDIKGRFITPSIWTAYQTMFQIMKQGYGLNPFRLAHLANSREAQICLGRNGTAWVIGETSTGIQLQDNTEYFIRWYSDFSKKYSLIEDVWTEDEAGTNYKYTLTLRPWNGPEDNAEPILWDYYTTYRFGASSSDVFSACGVGYDNYNLNQTSYFNVLETSINGKVFFADNIHVVPRTEDATVLPKLPNNIEDDTEPYVVVANGVTEEYILATPQKQLDAHAQQLIAELNEKQKQIMDLLNQQTKSLANETASGIARLKNASNVVTHAEVVPVYPVIQSFYDEDTGSFYHIMARNEHGYYCIQGGLFGLHNANNVDTVVTFFKKFKDIKYQAFAIQSHYDDVQYTGVWDKQLHCCMFGQVYNNQGNASWFAMGYLADGEVTE